MMQRSEHLDGATVWSDIASDDPDATAAFYRSVFGWDTIEGGPETGGYRTFVKGDAGVSGLGPRMMPEQPLVWSVYIKTSDIDATLAKATAHGAVVIAPAMQVLDLGKMAVFFDPFGAAIGLWQPLSMKGYGLVDEHGAWAWTELMVGDVDGAAHFYGEVFGWEKSTMSLDPVYYEMKINDTSVAGIMARPEQVPDEMPNFWSVYFTVDSINDAIDAVQGGGGTTIVGPMEIGPGTFAQFLDPNGAVFGVLEPRG